MFSNTALFPAWRHNLELYVKVDFKGQSKKKRPMKKYSALHVRANRRIAHCANTGNVKQKKTIRQERQRHLQIINVPEVLTGWEETHKKTEAEAGVPKRQAASNALEN